MSGNNKSESIVHCKKCGFETQYGKMRRHHIDVHGMTINKNKVAAPEPPPNALDMFQNMREHAKKAMIQIDQERDQIHHRLLELDGLAAQIKKVL